MQLLNSQISKNTFSLTEAHKGTAVKNQLKTLQAIQTSVARDVTILKEKHVDGSGNVTIKNLDDVVKVMENKLNTQCRERAANRYPFGCDPGLSKLAKKDTELTQSEIQNCLTAMVSFSDSIVCVVVLDIIGIQIKNPPLGRLFSDFAKNLVLPLCNEDPEGRIKQKVQFSKFFISWEKLTAHIVNPGLLNATTLIKNCRVCFYALSDICAERLPLGIKIKSLGMNCMVPQSNQQKNGHILEKLVELKPKLISKYNSSFEPWPKSGPKVTWSPTMKAWAKDQLPLGKSSQYIDINTPHDAMSTVVSQKLFAYESYDPGNNYKNNVTIRKQNVNTQSTEHGNSGLSVWDICKYNN